MFEAAERLLKREIENILKIPMIVGLPQPEWVKKSGYPFGLVMLDSVKILDWIEDGAPEDSIEQDKETVIENYALAEAEMIFTFQLYHNSKVLLDQLTLQLLYALSQINVIANPTQEDEAISNSNPTAIAQQPKASFQLGPISFRDELPEDTSERIFIRIFSIPLTGDITETVSAKKGQIIFIPAISPSEDVLT